MDLIKPQLAQVMELSDKYLSVSDPNLRAHCAEKLPDKSRWNGLLHVVISLPLTPLMEFYQDPNFVSF